MYATTTHGVERILNVNLNLRQLIEFEYLLSHFRPNLSSAFDAYTEL